MTSNRLAGAFLAATMALGAFPAAAYVPQPFMLKDIRPGIASSSPGSFAQLGDVILFAADDGARGAELWRTDGTTAGTYLVRDIRPGVTGSGPASLVRLGDRVMFSANDGVSGRELWATDGTAAGTVLVADIRAGALSSSPRGLVELGGALVFTAMDTATGLELWRSDGSGAGTWLVKDIRPGPQSGVGGVLRVVNGAVFLGADNGVVGRELWRSDGTTAGTALVKDINPGAAASSPEWLVASGERLFLTAATRTFGTELWTSDGTAAGTTLVKDIVPGPGSPGLQSLANVNGNVYFACDARVGLGFEPWTSDGTAAGTTFLGDLYPGLGGSTPRDFRAVGRIALFVAIAPSGVELFSSDGTSGGTALLPTAPGGSAPEGFIDVDGELVFAGSSPTFGRELWKTDGTASGTAMAAEINPGPASGAPTDLFYAASLRQVFFTAAGAAGGRELWSFYKNEPPDCSASFASPDVLWPPNHDMVPVHIQGVVDPDGDDVIVAVTDVASDEPVDGGGDADTSPDAELAGGQTLLRSERGGTGNGRVYAVTFTATDVPFGATCEATVVVCVPHDMGGGRPGCWDDGPIFAATTTGGPTAPRGPALPHASSSLRSVSRRQARPLAP